MEVFGYTVTGVDYPVNGAKHPYANLTELFKQLEAKQDRLDRRDWVRGKVYAWFKTAEYRQWKASFVSQYGVSPFIAKKGGHGFLICHEFALPAVLRRQFGVKLENKIHNEPGIIDIAGKIIMNSSSYLDKVEEHDIPVIFWGKVMTSPAWKDRGEATARDNGAIRRLVNSLTEEDSLEILDYASCLLPCVYHPLYALQLAINYFKK